MEEEEGMLVLSILFAREERIERRRKLRSLRDAANPFSMPESIFVANFRLPRRMCKRLIEELEPHDTHKSSIPFTLRFLAALYFYAHGSYQKCVGNYYNLGMSQSTVSRILFHVSKLIVRVKGNQALFPRTPDEQMSVKTGYYRAFGIKGTIGAVDCTHIAIHSPSANDVENPLSLYMNRKGFYSINVEAVCDHRLVFTSVNAKFPGSCHDSGIWTTSSVKMHLMRNYNSQNVCWLLGDQGYPLEPWLLTPVTEPANEKERKYNRLHAKARNTIERAFGVLKARFRCLSRHRVLHYSHEKSANIIYACSILHNMIMLSGVPLDTPEDIVQNEILPSDAQNSVAESSTHHVEGERVRSRYINSF